VSSSNSSETTPPLENAGGRCRLILEIDAVRYAVRPLADRSGWLLTKRGSRDAHAIVDGPLGIVCSCADFRYRRGPKTLLCKHAGAIRAAGLIG
jgi:hypothetical protein